MAWPDLAGLGRTKMATENNIPIYSLWWVMNADEGVQCVNKNAATDCLGQSDLWFLSQTHLILFARNPAHSMSSAQPLDPHCQLQSKIWCAHWTAKPGNYWNLSGSFHMTSATDRESFSRLLIPLAQCHNRPVDFHFLCYPLFLSLARSCRSNLGKYGANRIFHQSKQCQENFCFPLAVQTQQADSQSEMSTSE